MNRLRVIACLLAIVLAGCASPRPSDREPTGLVLPPGYHAEVFAEGLDGPTQMIVGPDGEIWVAQLAGEENAGQGQVIAVRTDSNEKRVLLDELLKPTGIAVTGDAVWIAAGRDVLRARLNASGEAGEPEVVLADLPFNGRSNGTLTVTPDGHLVFETSGNRIGDSAEEGSATLWELDPADPSNPHVLATGLKNAYGHTVAASGRLWVTDVADDPVNGEPPPDELNLVVNGADFGWPRCFGERQPARNYNGTDSECANTRASVTTFAPRSTPTSVAVSPWEEDVLLVALWGPTEPSVVRVKIAAAGDNAIVQEVTPFITGLKHPQHLLVLDDGSLLASDFEDGIIYRVTRP